jgi:AmmeMemoRadiSam system protein B/AmmeMemoRadiSam system protein A
MSEPSTANVTQGRIRPPAVAGFFYPGDKAALQDEVHRYLDEAQRAIPAKSTNVPKAIIAPHAGYRYSGLTAAAAYRALAPARGIIKRVVMMGPCHRVAVRGLALSSADAFHTPLGDVAVDKQTIAAIASLPQVQIFDATHKDDHALEVHLPFLQVVLGDFKIVPMIVGDARTEEVSEVLEKLWGGPETLILISSDLSHYLAYGEAQKMDDTTRQAIERLDADALVGNMACGRHSIRGLLKLARERGMTITTADLRNSGDTAGPKDKVVGYGSWLLHERPDVQRSAIDLTPASNETSFGGETRALLDHNGTALLRLAAEAIEAVLDKKIPFRVETAQFAPELSRQGAAFVTLDKDHKLRGCIGSITPHRALLSDIAENACKAAFQDPRFPPLTKDEIVSSHISMHISVLSPQVPMTFASEEDLIGQLRPKRDGLVLQDQGRRGVFLPVVWDSIPEPKAFLNHLKRKAGLSETHWSDTVQVWRFTTEGVSSEDMPAGTSLWKL